MNNPLIESALAAYGVQQDEIVANQLRLEAMRSALRQARDEEARRQARGFTSSILGREFVPDEITFLWHGDHVQRAQFHVYKVPFVLTYVRDRDGEVTSFSLNLDNKGTLIPVHSLEHLGSLLICAQCAHLREAARSTR